MVRNGAKKKQNVSNIDPKVDFLRKGAESASDLLFFVYYQHLPSQNAPFSVPRATKKACGIRNATFSLCGHHFGSHFGKKSGESGSPGCLNTPQGL